VIWTLEEKGLRAATQAAIAEAALVAVSAVTAWEIALKQNLGKLRPPVPDVLSELAARDYTLLPITPEHAWAGGALPLHHRDPFDRILVAQAQLEGMTIVTRDPKIARYQVAVMPA